MYVCAQAQVGTETPGPGCFLVGGGSPALPEHTHRCACHEVCDPHRCPAETPRHWQVETKAHTGLSMSYVW